EAMMDCDSTGRAVRAPEPRLLAPADRAAPAVAVALIGMLVAACGGKATAIPAPTPNLEATIQAGLAATATAQVAAEATLLASVGGTVTAMADVEAPATATAEGAEASTSSGAAATSGMSEEELAAVVEAAVDDALDAAEEAQAAADEAAADGTVDDAEAVDVNVTLTGADEALAEADDLIAAYADEYGDYADESLDSLQAIESDLASISEAVDEMATILGEGQSSAQEAADTISAATKDLQQSAASIRERANRWADAAETAREARVRGAIAALPSGVTNDPVMAAGSAAAYLDMVRNAVADGRVSRAELDDIAKTGAGAAASLRAVGAPAGKEVADKIDDITRQIARGDWKAARAAVDTLDAAVRDLPANLGPGIGRKRRKRP
ncbi:MAG: hypothetical protein ACE5EL_09000, partial [Anaerolineae bacterium]